MLSRLEEMIRQRQELVSQLHFLDAGLWLGPPEGFPLASEFSLEQLIQTAERTGIVGGLVSHWHGKTLSAQEGNRALNQTLEGLWGEGGNPQSAPPPVDGGGRGGVGGEPLTDRFGGIPPPAPPSTGGSCLPKTPLSPLMELSAVWTALPLFPAEPGPLPGSSEVPGPSWVRAARIFPRTHHFPLASWSIGSLCEWLQERRMPLFIRHTELEWPALYDLARSFPQLPLVVETQTQKILYHTRPLFALLRDCANVYVEMSNFAGAGYLEYVVREFGPERLLFGSFLPVADPLVPLGMILDADLPFSVKRLPAGDNLRRLLAEVRT